MPEYPQHSRLAEKILQHCQLMKNKPSERSSQFKIKSCKMEIQRGNGKSKKYSWLSVPSSFPVYKKSEASCLESCICQRKRGLIICTCCQKSFVGRIGERCLAHPEIAYLMDARNCAFCGAAAKDLRMAADQM